MHWPAPALVFFPHLVVEVVVPRDICAGSILNVVQTEDEEWPWEVKVLEVRWSCYSFFCSRSVHYTEQKIATMVLLVVAVNNCLDCKVLVHK